MKKLIAGESSITFHEAESLLTFDGSMRLANMKEYDVVAEFLRESSESSPTELTMDLRSLRFLNSSGITTLSLFILSCKKNGNPQITVLKNDSISWQQKSVTNFKKLWDDVEIRD